MERRQFLQWLTAIPVAIFAALRPRPAKSARAWANEIYTIEPDEGPEYTLRCIPGDPPPMESLLNSNPRVSHRWIYDTLEPWPTLSSRSYSSR
jgi:hypothetical protein